MVVKLAYVEVPHARPCDPLDRLEPGRADIFRRPSSYSYVGAHFGREADKAGIGAPLCWEKHGNIYEVVFQSLMKLIERS